MSVMLQLRTLMSMTRNAVAAGITGETIKV